MENIKIYPSSDNLFFWKALLVGPKNSDYNKGYYVISIKFSERYP